MAPTRQPTAAAAANRALEALDESSLDLRAAAFLDPEGILVAATREGAWAERSAALWDAAVAADRPEPLQVHVGTDGGEVFAVRQPDLGSIVAVTNRFTLASLMFCDLRAALREIAGAAGPVERRGAA